MIGRFRRLKHFYAALGVVMLASALLPCCIDFNGQDCCVPYAAPQPGGCCGSQDGTAQLELPGFLADTGASCPDETGQCDSATCFCPCHLPVLTALPFELQVVLVPLGHLIDEMRAPELISPACIDHPPRLA